MHKLHTQGQRHCGSNKIAAFAEIAKSGGTRESVLEQEPGLKDTCMCSEMLSHEITSVRKRPLLGMPYYRVRPNSAVELCCYETEAGRENSATRNVVWSAKKAAS